jgi:V8-like Glu-specific endopeptidase
MSVYAQREAYRLDRARETRRREANQKAVAPPFMAAATGVPTPATGNKHQRVSNRTPVTASKEFAPAYGSNGKPTAPTMERVAVRMSRRPESAPAAGVPRAGRPIDAYWGSYGTAIERAAVRARVDHKGLEAIIGNDDRTRVADCTEYPWRCICSLLITANTGAQYIGTGWLVAPRVLLTAGHCVYMSDEGGWVTQIEVIPGRDADARPYGSAIAREVRSVGGWTVDGDSNYDYGVILLPSDKRYGDELGWLGYAHRDDDYLAGLTLNLSGYPADGGRAPNQVDGTQWYHSRNVKEVLPSQLTYEIDTFGGQSGSPVWEMTSSGDRYGVAVHTWGTSVSNGGTRITGEVFDNIVQWISEAP